MVKSEHIFHALSESYVISQRLKVIARGCQHRLPPHTSVAPALAVCVETVRAEIRPHWNLNVVIGA
jgi:hypothetical protein